MSSIVDAQVTRHLLSYKTPITTAKGTFAERPTIILSIRDQDGRIGLGEACPMTGFTHETIDETESAILNWLNDEGQDSPPSIPTARAAIEGALFDLRAKQENVSLSQHLNPESSLKIPVSVLVNGETSKELVSNAERILRDGFTSIKIKIGSQSPDRDISLVKAVRAAVGFDVSIRLDANGAWTPEEAISNLDRMSDLSIEFVEEPTSGIDNLKKVKSACDIPIAADETASDLKAIAALIDKQSVDCIILKPSAIGGIVPSSEVVHAARESGLDVVVTSMLESSIGINIAAHFSSAFQVTSPAPGLATSYLLVDDLASPLTLKDGHIHLD